MAMMHCILRGLQHGAACAEAECLSSLSRLGEAAMLEFLRVHGIRGCLEYFSTCVS